MPRTVSDVDTLQEYIRGVMSKANHHAQVVNEIVLTIAGSIIWRKDDDTEIEVRERNGQMGNVLWVTIGGRQYAHSWNRRTGTVEVRQDTLQGPTVARFDNNS